MASSRTGRCLSSRAAAIGEDAVAFMSGETTFGRLRSVTVQSRSGGQGKGHVVSQQAEQGDPVGIVGAGTMGAGIAQVAAVAGHPVRIVDARAGAAATAVSTAQDGIRRLVKRDLITAAQAEAAEARVSAAAVVTELAGCVIVIEAIAEDLAAKRQLLAELESVVAGDALLASNTSSLSLTALGSALDRPERLVGLHFFNPAHRMRLVEVVRGDRSGPAYVELATNLMRSWGKTPVQCVSTPGFIVNRVARP